MLPVAAKEKKARDQRQRESRDRRTVQNSHSDILSLKSQIKNHLLVCASQKFALVD